MKDYQNKMKENETEKKFFDKNLEIKATFI
jgi:hypothetical protein